MATPNRLRDTRFGTPDLGELSKILKHKKAPEPAEAKPFSRPDLKRTRVRLPWTYDLEYGWTPERETLEPRPPLNVPPYYAERFHFQTAGLKQGGPTYIMIDLRQFPRASRVFVRLPARLVRPARLAELQQGTADAPDGAHATVPATTEVYNQLFAETEAASVTADTVLVELEPRTRVILDQLQLDADAVDLEIRYAVLRDAVRPKTQYVIHFAQLIDGCLVGEFEHLFQAYHHYDIPIVGDKRIKVAYRRSSAEVSTIPPLALAFFDDWTTAAAYGYDPAPQSFSRHFRPEHASKTLTRRILDFVNDPDLTADALIQRIVDNAFVDDEGEAEAEPKVKRGLNRPTAERILAARDELPKRRFVNLQQIDAVSGVGDDTMSDIITSFLVVDPAADDDQWYPDDAIVRLLSPDVERALRRVVVTLERITVLDDHEPWFAGPGELVFGTLVAPDSDPNRAQRRRIPERGHLSLRTGESINLDVVVFEGQLEDGATLDIAAGGVELDRYRVFQRRDRLARYRRVLRGAIGEWAGTYAPGDEPDDPESLRDWEISFRVEVE